MIEQDTQYVDADSINMGFAEKASFRIIILEHLRNILRLGNTEFREGHHEERHQSSNGGGHTTLVYVPSTQDAYINSIDNFCIILSPHFDKKMEDDERQIEEEYKAEKQKIIDDIKMDENKKHNRWGIERIHLKQKLFRALSGFLYRKKYLELGEMSN